MSQEYFVSVLRERYAAMSPSERKQKIRELVSESPEDAKVIQRLFPEFFNEAFPSSKGNGAGRHSVSHASPSLAAKRS